MTAKQFDELMLNFHLYSELETTYKIWNHYTGKKDTRTGFILGLCTGAMFGYIHLSQGVGVHYKDVKLPTYLFNAKRM